MSGTAEVLQEYLVSLGFQTDAISLRKFEDGLSATGKKVLGVGVAVAGVVASVEAASAAFAYSMRKIYFESELSNTTVKNLKSMEFAGKQVGITGDSMASSIHAMAQAMRLNPGLQGLVQSFGVKVTGRHMDDVMMDYVKALKSMPEFAGAQYAGMFGMDPDTYHQMITHYDELAARKKQLMEMYKTAGVDPDAAKKTMLEYTTSMDELENRLSILSQALLIKFAPVFKVISQGLNNLLDMMTADLDPNDPKAQKNEQAELDRIWAKSNNPYGSKARAYGDSPRIAGGAPMDIMQSYGWTKEQSAGIIANLNAESEMKPRAVGDFNKKKGSHEAYGIAQWHSDRQQDFKDWAKKDIRESTLEEQLAFVNYELTQGKEQAAGNRLKGAKSAREAGSIVSRYYERPAAADAEASLRGVYAARLGAAPSNGAAMTQTTTINVTGTNAGEIGKSVAREQSRVNADQLRNFRGAVG